MNDTTPINSLFSQNGPGKFLAEHELIQIHNDLSQLIEENKQLSIMVEQYKTSPIPQSSSIDSHIHGSRQPVHNPPPRVDATVHIPTLTNEQLNQVQQLRHLTSHQLQQLSPQQHKQLEQLQEQAQKQEEDQRRTHEYNQQREQENNYQQAMANQQAMTNQQAMANQQPVYTNDLEAHPLATPTTNKPLSIFHTQQEFRTSSGEVVSVTIDLQLIYLMLFIILMILILKK